MLLSLYLLGERWRVVLPSTWKLTRAGGLRRLLNLSTLHAYVYGRWTNQYIRLLASLMRVGVIESCLGPRSKQWLANMYHAKVLTAQQASSIITMDRDIPLCHLEHVIPYPIAHDLLLNGPPDVAVYECACRHARVNPCQPTQVCMVVGQPFVDFVLEHNPGSSRRLTQTEALELLEAEHERGHVHTAWFKDVMLDRFFAICNCCKCCCVGIEAMTKYGFPALASSGYIARVDEAECTGCGNCADVCAFGALRLEDVAVVEWDLCMGCGMCRDNCPSEAIDLVRDHRKGDPLDVRLLATPAD